MSTYGRIPSTFGRRATWCAALSLLAGVGLPIPALAAQLNLQFGTLPVGAPPSTFRPALSGGGAPGQWQVIRVETPSALPALNPDARPMNRQVVIAQVSEDPADERFPLLIYEPEIFSDFTATLRFQTVRGRVERMAGLAFRLQDEKNYYVVRASSLGNSFRFYKFVNGVRSEPIGPEIKITSGEWHSIEVRCKGNTIRCRLDGKDAIPELNDQSFTRGKLALWTKSDSVSYFEGLSVDYDVVKTLPQRLVERAVSDFPRLMAVTIYGREDGKGGKPAALASSDAALVGTAGADAEEKALATGLISAGVGDDHSSAVFPLRDRNGDPLLALRLRLRKFPGQTEANAAARGKQIADQLQKLVQAADASGEIPGRQSEDRLDAKQRR
jgi:hypothetical protein